MHSQETVDQRDEDPISTVLPIPIDSFVGRTGELADIGRLLAARRLVTLTGPGGSGKTRLALEFASTRGRAYRDGVWMVDLVRVSDPELVPQAVAAELGIREQHDQTLPKTLVRSLAPRHALLVLDNCEHVAGACAELVRRLLEGTPWLRVLATSREVLQAWHRVAPDLEASEVQDLLEALSSPPGYRLPPAVPGHTRHYMPDQAHRREVQLAQTLVFDAFLRLDPTEPLIVRWDASLSESHVAALRRLAAGITYLGRSESWCEVEVTDDGDPETWDSSAAPLGEEDPEPGWEVVRLLAPAPPLDLRALEVSTAELQGGRQKRRDPPGARWLRYSRPEQWARGGRHRRPRDRGSVADAVVWALEGSPPSLLRDVEEVARTVRSLIALRESEATGRVHVLPYTSQPSAKPVRLDRVALWAEGGLDAREVDIACGLKPFAVSGASGVQVLLLLWFGWRSGPSDSLFGPGRTWRSVTPLLPWRQVRIGGPAGTPASGTPLLVADVIPQRLGTPESVGPAGDPVGWLDFRRGLAIGARLEFSAPVTGPVVAERQPPGFGLFLCEG